MSSWLTVDQVLLFLSRFNHIVRELRSRPQGRPSFDLKDEMDVRDLAYAGLKPLVHDLAKLSVVDGPPSPRAELGSHALGLVIEVKSTLRLGGETNLARECNESVVRHVGAEGSAARHLVFFLYDPDDLLPDHAGIVRDLSGTRKRIQDELVVHVAGPGFHHTPGPSADFDARRFGFSTLATSDQESMLRLRELLLKGAAIRKGEPISFAGTDLELHLRPGTTRRLIRATLGEHYLATLETEETIAFEELPSPNKPRQSFD